MLSGEKQERREQRRRKTQNAKPAEKFARLHELEKNLVVLEDMSVVSSLLIMALALIFVIDIARYQWILMMILILGFFLNLMLFLTGFLRKKWIFCGLVFLLMLCCLGTLIYLLVI